MIASILLTSGCSTNTALSGEMDAVSSRTTSFANCNFEDITIILNQTGISNYEQCAEEIIQHVINNDFHTIRFSFNETGYPNSLTASVYLTKSDLKKQ